MNLCFGEAQVKEYVEAYYRETEDFEGKLDISCRVISTPSFGRSILYDNFVSVKMTMRGEVDVDGMKVPTEEEVSEEKLRGIFESRLEKTGYSVTKFALKKSAQTQEKFSVFSKENAVVSFGGVEVEVSGKKLIK